MSTPHRPGRGETEEDLLKFQEEFLAKKETPSVKIIKKSDTMGREISKDGDKKSARVTFNAESRGAGRAQAETNEHGASLQPRVEPIDKPVLAPNWMNAPSEMTGTIFSGSHNETIDGKESIQPKKRKSLFALRMEKSRSDAKRNTDELVQVNDSQPAESIFGERSFILSGREADEIHKQNMAQLERLSVKEIEEERQRLMSQLSSSTIKFLQSRRKRDDSVEPKEESLKPKCKITSILKSPPENSASSIHEKPAVAEKKNLFSNSFASGKNLEEPKLPETDLFTTLPINPNEAKQWLHMNIVEKDKLEWMKELPPVKQTPGPDERYAARFDFHGLLLPYNDEKLDVNKGLHHHGDEPERPGYTLQELMQLSRSSVQQQRIMGLTTLGNVLVKAKLGIYDKVLEQNIIKELLDAGIFLLLRFSLDDLSPPVVIAALTALRNLLFNDPDEASLDYLLGCEGGLQNPLLEVPYDVNDAKQIQEQKDHEAELKDFEIIQLDVLKGAQRTNLIVRLGYILDVIKGPPDVVLDVLIRIARHSRQLAESIVSCGGLLRTIRDELLTTHVVSSGAASFGQPGYGEPSAKALRLMRVLAGHSRTIANTLLDKFNIMEPVMTYVSMSSPGLPHIQSLVVQGFYLWQTFMSYGLASQTLIDLFPILMRQLHYHAQITSAIALEASASSHELATALIGIVERASDIVLSDHNVLDAKPVFQLAKLIVDCLRKWLSQLSTESTEMPSWSCVKMIGAAFNCMAIVANCANKQDLSDSQSVLEKLESFIHGNFLPFLRSSCIQKLLENLKPCSYFLSSNAPGSKRDPSNLPSLGAMEWAGESLVPGLLPKAPHPLLSGLLRFMGITFEIFGLFSKEVQLCILDSIELDKYIHALISEPLQSSNHWFCRQEIYMLHHLVVFVALQSSIFPCKYQTKYSQLSFRLVDLVQANDKYLISSLLPITIFSPKFIKCGMNPFSSENKNYDLLAESLARLPSIAPHYLDILGVRFCRVPPPSQRTSLTSLPKGTEPALPVDWQFAPLLLLYGQYNAPNRARWSERDTTTIVTNCLQFLLLNEALWPESRRPLTVTARWCRLALVFLAGSDLFLDHEVKIYLSSYLYQLLLEYKKLDFSETIPGLSSFYDLYGELLLQFSAASYGDKLFGAFLLLPLQQKQDPQLRRMVWGEHAVVLKMLGTPIEEVGVPAEEYLEPCETDPSLLSLYLEAVAKGHIIEERCPVLYNVAIHHVATFINKFEDHPFAVCLRKRINNLGNKALQRKFLEYQKSFSSQLPVSS